MGVAATVETQLCRHQRLDAEFPDLEAHSPDFRKRAM